MIKKKNGRSILLLLLVLTFMLSFISVPTSSSQTFGYQSSTSKVIDSTVNPINATYNREKLITFNGYQYTAYWDLDNKLVLARRKLSDNTVQTIKFTGSDETMEKPNDGHYFIVLGISPNDGRLHLSYNHHVTPHRYMVSNANWLTSPPANMNTNQFTKTYQVAGYDQNDVTYPQYFNDMSGNLYFSYRMGINDNGDQMMNKYDSSTGTWSLVGKIIHGKSGSGTYTGVYTSTTRYSYTSNFIFDKNNRLHVAWSWRERSPGSTNGQLYEHDLCYAYSDDYGVTWKNNAGTKIADMNSGNPIRVNDSGTVVVSVPQQRWIHGCTLSLDSHNQPHILTQISTNATDKDYSANAHNIHYWRNTDGQWFSRFLSDTSEFKGLTDEYFGTIIFDSADNAHAVYTVSQMGWYSGLNLPNLHWSTGGYIGSEITDNESEMLSTNQNLTIGSDNPIVKIRFKNSTSDSQAKFWWITKEDNIWREVIFSTIPNSDYTEYTINLTGNQYWTGTAYMFAFDPVVNVSGGSFSADYIRIGNGSTNIKTWEFTKPWTLTCVESSPHDNYQALDTYDLMPNVAMEAWDNGYSYDFSRLASSNIASIATVQRDPSNGNASFNVSEFTISTTTKKVWEFASSTEFWKNEWYVPGFAWQSGGYAGGTITSGAPYSEVVSDDNLGTSIGNSKYIKIRYKNSTSATTAKLWFRTNQNPTWSESRTKTFTVTPNDSSYRVYTIDMSTLTGWTNSTLKQLAFDPTLSAINGSFSIDYIYITP